MIAENTELSEFPFNKQTNFFIVKNGGEVWISKREWDDYHCHYVENQKRPFDQLIQTIRYL